MLQNTKLQDFFLKDFHLSQSGTKCNRGLTYCRFFTKHSSRCRQADCSNNCGAEALGLRNLGSKPDSQTPCHFGILFNFAKPWFPHL